MRAETTQPSNTDRALILIVPAVVLVASSLAVGILIAADLLGESDRAGLVFCEASQPGWVKQPANSWSNAGFAVAGLLVALTTWRNAALPGKSADANRMRATVLYPALYASVVVFVGPGSFALHATTTVWGGKIDVISMYLWAAFAVVYAWTRRRDLDEPTFGKIFGGLSGFLVFQQVTDVPAIDGTILFGIVLVAYAVLEAAEVFRHDVAYRRAWLWVAAAAFVVAFGIWLASRTGGPLCDPHSLVQGHAVWHLLNAVAMFALFRLYLSERRSTGSIATDRRP